MKLRRAILGVVVLGGLLVLILAVTGVFSRERTIVRPNESPSADGSDAATRPGRIVGQPVIKSFRAEGENWVLTGTQAEFGVGEEVILENPLLQVREPGDEAKGSVEARADLGTYTPEPAKRLEMSGNVRVEVVGQEKVLLLAETVLVQLDDEIARTEGPVQVIMTTAEGRQMLSGRGAEADLKQRRANVLQDVRMELTGTAPLFPEAQADPDKPADVVPMQITCRGPCVADGFKRSVILENDVVLIQGEGELRAQRVEVFFPEEGRKPERFTAEGAVAFRGGGAEGRCDRLVHSAAEEQILLEGSPAAVSQGSSEIEASRIEMDLASGRMFVPVAGRLKFAQPDADGAAGPELSVDWQNSMAFDRAEHQAVVRGDVRFSYNEQIVHCDRLGVWFDETNRQLVKCRAEGNVRLTGRLVNLSGADEGSAPSDAPPVTASGREMVYDPVEETVQFLGAAVLQQGGQVVRGEEIALQVRDRSIRVTGAGSLEAEPEEGETASGLSAAWTGGMQFDQASGKAEFDREVELQHANRTLTADHVTAQIAADRRLEGFDATGSVVLREEGDGQKIARTLHSNRVGARMGRENVVEGFEATGNVVMREDDLEAETSRILRADRVDSKIGTDNAVERFDAFGNVVFEQGDAVGRGEQLRWDVEKDLGILVGTPVRLEMGRNRLTGDKIEFARERGRIRVTSKTRVEATLLTEGQKLRDIVPR